jgi:hypothetical protein
MMVSSTEHASLKLKGSQVYLEVSSLLMVIYTLICLMA